MQCKFCGGKQKRYISTSKFIIRKCSNCKIAVTEPSPIIPKYSEMDFHSCTKDSNTTEQSLTDLNNLPKDWARLIEIQSEMVQKHLPVNSRVLEIGCGEGILLNEISKHQYKVYGIEPSITAYNRAMMRGIECINGIFPHQKFEGKFDIIIMSHVLEHIEDIGHTVAELVKVSPGGYLLLTQTNYRGLIPRRLRGKWYAWVPDQHFYHFTLQGLEKFLNNFGYKKIDYEYSSLVHPNDLWYKLAQLKENWIDQFTVLFKNES